MRAPPQAERTKGCDNTDTEGNAHTKPSGPRKSICDTEVAESPAEEVPATESSSARPNAEDHTAENDRVAKQAKATKPKPKENEEEQKKGKGKKGKKGKEKDPSENGTNVAGIAATRSRRKLA
ncbi:hypothetical protein FRC07_003108 [Ceratobasidium sp. 392]|nr:hypothetical protein FRC07_003108 [Ceratobasidium sp. 392]